jgi:phage tail sheath protein FI
MAVQVSYPGVYIDEFEPGAPIEGVGTNTAVFLGIAETGPINTPTLITGWDRFKQTFGGFLADPGAWLAQGVHGFFLNGGTRCYVVRVSSARTASVTLKTRNTGDALVLTALAEGPDGNGIEVTTSDASRSKAAVTVALTRPITRISADLTTLTVAGGVADLNPGDTITLRRGTDSASATLATVTAPDTLVLTAALAAAPDFAGGRVEGTFDVRVLVATGGVSAVAGDRKAVTLGSATHRFGPGDRVLFTKGADTAAATVSGVNGATLTLAPALPDNVNFAEGTVRSADLPAGTRALRLNLPAGLSISAAFPRGSLLAFGSWGGTVFVRVAASGGDTLQLDAPGVPATALDTQANAVQVATADFDLAVHSPISGTTEVFGQLSMDPRSPGYWGQIRSAAFTVALPDDVGEPTAAGDDRPEVALKKTAGGVADDRAASWASLTASPDAYLAPLARLRDVSLVAVPGGVDAGVQQAVVAHCESLMDRFAILDCAQGLDQTGAANHFATVRSERGYAALYYPWIQVRDPGTGAMALWPPSGHLTGVYARTDSTRGVHKAPANTTLRGALGIETALSDAEQGPLNLMGLNVLRVFPGQSQPTVWGARTTAGDLNRNWQYVNIRRLFIYAEQSIERGIRWAVFEPNDLALWQKLKRSIGDFLTGLWRDGALFGAKASDAFYVRIDEELNPPSTRALGRLYIEVGMVPTYPAEFIVLRIGIWNGGSEVTTS